LKAARARGIKGGRKPKLDASKQKTAQTMYDARNYTIKEICETLKVTKPTLYKYLKR
jgi:DNA invertase Pin-like site-specific DNA recombinase